MTVVLLEYGDGWISPADKVWMAKPFDTEVAWVIDEKCATNENRAARLLDGWQIIRHELSI